MRTQLEARTDLSSSEQLLLNRLRETLDDKDTGNYELLIYSFAQRSRIDGVDVLRGRGGVDFLEGGNGDDYNITIQVGNLPTVTQGSALLHTVQYVDRGGARQNVFVDYGDGSGEIEVPVDAAGKVSLSVAPTRSLGQFS